MKIALTLRLSFLAFFAGTMGSDVAARTFVAGQTLKEAFGSHVHFMIVEPTGAFLLFAPFLGVGLVSAAVEKWARTRSAVIILAIGTLPLLFFYFFGYWAAQEAMLEGKFTAATLSVGLLPLLGIPILFVVMPSGALAVDLHCRKTITSAISGAAPTIKRSQSRHIE